MKSSTIIAWSSVSATKSTARTAAARTGSGIRGRWTGSSTHNGLRAPGRSTRRVPSMAAHLPQWLPALGLFPQVCPK
ncbi:hypothetical protein GCM10010357_55670 [Streptomyces luteireticuli]|uniref:Uncharacterized protein n=1 Tax=Streptomyces luteireticuli TaxID=173858 RepID=A0ABN0Z0I9_9ACTN